MLIQFILKLHLNVEVVMNLWEAVAILHFCSLYISLLCHYLLPNEVT